MWALIFALIKHLFFQPHPIYLIFWEDLCRWFFWYHTGEDRKEERPWWLPVENRHVIDDRSGVGPCHFCSSWGCYLKKTLPHDWRRFSHIRHRPAASVSVTCHGVTLHIGIGELTDCGCGRRDCWWVVGVIHTCLIRFRIPREVCFLVSPSVQDNLSRTQVEDSAEGTPWWLLLNRFHIMRWWWKFFV